jgi:hypothetical protein
VKNVVVRILTNHCDIASDVPSIIDELLKVWHREPTVIEEKANGTHMPVFLLDGHVFTVGLNDQSMSGQGCMQV